jgi:Na+/H+-dicarboxylate symporter
MNKMPLLLRLLLAIVAGFVLGIATRGMVDQGMLWAVIPGRLLATFNAIFGNFLSFIVPLLILAFVSVGIADLGKGTGKMLGFAVLIAYISTVLGGLFAYTVGSNVIPTLVGGVGSEALAVEGGMSLNAIFSIPMPPLFSITSSLVAAFVLGMGVAALGDRGPFYQGLHTLQQIVEKVITAVIIPLLPFHIAGVFTSMAFDGQALKVMGVMVMVFGLIVVMHWVLLTVWYTVAGSLSGKNPFVMIKNMIPAYLAAVGTQSSAATMPVTRAQTLKNGADEGVVNFTIPLFATIHMPGSIITITTCAMAVSTMMGHPIDAGTMVRFIFTAAIMMVAAPGVPGGAIMAASAVLQSVLGFDATMLSLMIALYLAQDSFGTATNVTGDGALTFFVEKFAKKTKSLG